MSVHSNHYDDPNEYERDLRYEYRTEQAGLYHYDDDEPTIPYCEECIYCKEVMIWERKGRYVAPEYLDNEKWPDGDVYIFIKEFLCDINGNMLGKNLK